MRIVVEGEKYELDLLRDVFGSSMLYNQKNNFGTITFVGYYHSFDKNELVYLLPKVFIINGKVFGKYTPKELFENNFYIFYKHKQDYSWIRKLLYFFYVGLSKFRGKYLNNTIIETSQSIELSSNLGNKEYSYLDLVLSFVNFYKKNKNTILLHHIENTSNQFKRPNWTKTVIKSTPIFDRNGNPLYSKLTNKRKIVNHEEEVLIYFYSILNHFNKEHHLNISLDKSFKITEGKTFERLQKVGFKKLKQIKYKYYSDFLKRMYMLCELYFSRSSIGGVRKKKDEFLLVRNYNIVFEDMVDTLFSDQINTNEKVNNISLNDLKYNRDGKIIDHLYEYESLIDTSNIFYIGDSKYYKSEAEAGQESIYKQFSYAKNIIQFNIDLFNAKGCYSRPKIKYRDELTEGYNISPNFFIYGYINNLNEFDNPLLQQYKKAKRSYHFKNRLFDRDTLFVHFYQLNFLFVLKAYTSYGQLQIKMFQDTARDLFKRNFLDYFNNDEECNFKFFEKKFDNSDLHQYVNKNFRSLNGKCITIDNDILIVAKHNHDNEISELIIDFTERELR